MNIQEMGRILNGEGKKVFCRNGKIKEVSEDDLEFAYKLKYKNI